MGNEIQEIRAHVAEMIAADKAMLADVAVRLHSPELQHAPEARWLLERLERTLNAHIDELAEHLRRLGGTSPNGARQETLARSLEEYFTALSSAHAGALILETNARTRGYSSTAALATRHREEMASVLAGICEALPKAITGELVRAQA
jgi:hypothetical protein